MIWLVYAFLGVLVSVFTNILQKRALNNVSVPTFLAIRGIYIIIILSFFIPFVNFNYPLYVWILFILVAFLAAIAVWLRNLSFKNIEISTFSPLHNLKPFVVLAMSFLILSEIPNMYQVFGIFFIVVGTYLLNIHKGNKWYDPILVLLTSKYYVLLLLSFLILGFTVSLDRFLLTNYVNPFSYIFFIWFMMNMFLIIFSLTNYTLIRNEITDNRTNLIYILWPSILIVLLHIFFYMSLELAYASLVTSIFILETLVTTIFGGYLFKEKDLLRKSIASFIVIIGATLIIIF